MDLRAFTPTDSVIAVLRVDGPALFLEEPDESFYGHRDVRLPVGEVLEDIARVARSSVVDTMREHPVLRVDSREFCHLLALMLAHDLCISSHAATQFAQAIQLRLTQAEAESLGEIPRPELRARAARVGDDEADQTATTWDKFEAQERARRAAGGT